jgi:Ribbon-helix-helix protein, copG family
VRTTLSLDEDIAARLQSEARRTGQPFKALVNELLRSGLAQRRPARRIERFEVEAHNFGALKPGVSLDSIGALLEQLEGPDHR